MDRKEFVAAVDAFERAYESLVAKISTLDSARLAFVPSIPDAWSINEHLVHLLDADCNLVLRLRGAVAEPGRNVPVWDPEAWRGANVYAASDGAACLAIAAKLRVFIGESLKSLDDATREAANVIHPERGKLTLADLLKIYTNHADFHMKYVVRNLEAFDAS